MKRSNLLPRAIVWGLCAAASLALSSPASAADGSWATKSPMTTARASLGAASIGGKAYVVGGYYSPDGTSAASTNRLEV